MPTPEEIAAAKLKADADAKAKEEADAAAALKAKEDGNEPPPNPDDLEGKLDAKAKDYIKGLRDEAAKQRVEKKQLRKELDDLKAGFKRALGLEGDEPPEQKIESLKKQTEAQALETAVLEAAVENGIGKGQLKYFKFLIQEKLGAMSDGDEMSEADMAEIVKEVKKAGGGSASNGTSVGTKGAPNPDNAGNTGDLTVERFAKLSITDKSLLYTKNADQYARLMKEAREKRLIQ